MTDFKTNNQDKSNLVGDAKGMDISELVGNAMVDDAQEIIRLKQEVRELKDEVRELEFNMGENHLSYQTQIINLTKRAKAWDDLEALVNLCRDSEFGLSVDQYSQEPNKLVIDKGEIDCYFYSSDLKVSVSNALESIRGES